MAVALLKDSHQYSGPISESARQISEARWASEMSAVLAESPAFSEWQKNALIESIVESVRASDVNKEGMARRLHSHGVEKATAKEWADWLVVALSSRSR